MDDLEKVLNKGKEIRKSIDDCLKVDSRTLLSIVY
jgi:hypothetical protein